MVQSFSPEDFRAMGPFEGEEIRTALKRVFNHPTTLTLARFLFPTWTPERVREVYDSVHDTLSFQDIIIGSAIKSLCAQTTAGVSASGEEGITRDRRYLFISNHRDIILDPAIFVYELHLRGFQTAKVALGDNLLVNDWITDLVKLNKSIIVRRKLGRRELFRASQMLSAYIRMQIEEGVDSVWIAQREGRAKDGNDRTQPSLLKMLGLAFDVPLVEALRALHVVPVAISYEYDPCDVLKAKEILLKRTRGEYQKAPDEDLRSMLAGLKGQKGRIHLAVGTDLSDALGASIPIEAHRDIQARQAATMIDERIHSLYRLWPSHFVAADLIRSSTHYATHYTPEEKEAFVNRMESVLKIQGDDLDRDALRKVFLEIYANPVFNRFEPADESAATLE